MEGMGSTILVALLVLVVLVGTSPGFGQRSTGPSEAASAHPTPDLSPIAPGTPFVTAAAINTTAITVAWSVPNGTVTNYTLSYARFYGVPIATVSVGTAPIYNETSLGYGLTYYFTVWAWNLTSEGNASNVAAAQTNPLPPVVPPFPWSTLAAVTMLSILGSLAFSVAAATLVAGRRSRRAEGAAAVALARSRPIGGEAEARNGYPRGKPGDRRSYTTVARR